MAPTIVTRAQWGARPPTSVQTVPWSDRTGVAIHYTAGPVDQTVKVIQNFHMDTNGWSDIGYNWLVDQAGRLYEGRGWTARGTHSAGENISHVAVCWIGKNPIQPTAAALATIRWVYDEACRRAGRTLSYSGHGQLAGEATSCPGDPLKAWIAQGMPTQEDDMEPDERSALRFIDGRNEALAAGRDEVANNPAFNGIGQPVWLVREVKAVAAQVAELVARPPVAAAPVDIDALAAALVPYLETAAEAAVRKVLGAVDN